jgi:hypothetical protein
MRSWKFCASLLLLAGLGLTGDGVEARDERCTLRFNRDEVDIVRGEIRIDLNRKVERECRGFRAGGIRLDQVTVELRDSDDRRGGGYDDRRYDGRGRRGRGDTYAIYRFYDGRRHLMSDDPDEGERFGSNEGAMFEVYRDGGRNRKAIYRCATSGGDRFLSHDSGCEGHSSEGQLGYLPQNPDGRDNQAVYRCFNGKLRDHIATKDQNECAAAGYKVELTLGYSR